MFASFFDRLAGGLQIALIIKGVEYSENINAAFRGMLDKGVNHVVSVIAIANQVLSTEKHLQGGIGH